MVTFEIEAMNEIIDIICLVYHEARNIRHPIKIDRVADYKRFERLVNLPNNRDQAWIAMSKIRIEALQCKDISEALSIFKKHFELDLADLRQIYERPIWQGSRIGGNKWAQISAKVHEMTSAKKTLPPLQSKFLICATIPATSEINSRAYAS